MDEDQEKKTLGDNAGTNPGNEYNNWSGGTNPANEDAYNKTTNGMSGVYGGGSSSPTANDKKAQANLGGISGYNFQTPQKMADLGDKVVDISDEGNANQRDYALKNIRRKSANEWYRTQQDLQSVTSQLADASGNLANGSGLLDFWDLIARRDDEQDVDVLNTARDNEADVWNNYYEVLQSNINDRNRMYVDAEEAMRGVLADYVAQSNSIHPDLAASMIDEKNHTLKPPDWMNPDSFAENRFRDAVMPEMQDFFRPAMDADTATKNKLVDREPTTANQSSTNKSYWDRMRSGYYRRNQ